MPAAPADPTIKTRLLSRPVRSSLGTIRLAGLNQGGIGVGVRNHTLRTLTHYGLNYVLGGEGIYRDARHDRVPVPAESLEIFFPKIPHASGTAPGKVWDELWFEFEGPIFELMQRQGILDPARPVSLAKGRDYWLRRLTNLIPPAHLRHQTPPDTIVLHFAHVLTDMIHAGRQPAASAQSDDWLHEACQLLSDEEAVPVADPAAVAKHLGLSYESFRKKFRQAMGVAPGKFQLDARTDRAVALLYQGRHTVREISELLGFCDEFYFSRCFKRRFGQSPRAFRKKNRGH